MTNDKPVGAEAFSPTRSDPRAGRADNTRLDRVARTTYSAVFSDACDRVGLRHQTLDPDIRPQTGTGLTLVGWARVARFVSVDTPPSRPYGNEIDFIDSLQPGDVVVLCGPGDRAALWGELFSAASRARGARGAVIDGLMRDQERVAQLDFAVYARGSQPSDSLGRVSLQAPGSPVVVGGVRVSDGDLVVADVDGVVAVPATAALDVMALAVEKASVERTALALVREGALLAEAWERFGVL